MTVTRRFLACSSAIVESVLSNESMSYTAMSGETQTLAGLKEESISSGAFGYNLAATYVWKWNPLKIGN